MMFEVRWRLLLVAVATCLLCSGCSDDASPGGSGSDAGDLECESSQDCPSGECVDGNCTAGMCGNGAVEADETCDGDCPSSCDDGDACTTGTLAGAAETCDAVCEFESISACVDGDGCCPGDCDFASDDDCTCGDGVVDDGETCDGDCPSSCDDGNACTTGTLTGAADECSAACSYETIDTCVDGDGCCPLGCGTDTDDDCQPGTTRWVNTFGDTGGDTARAVAVDGEGNLIATGSFVDSADFGDGQSAEVDFRAIFLVKYDSQGDLVWSRVFDTGTYDTGRSVAVDGDGHIVLTGGLSPRFDFGGGEDERHGSTDVFVAKFNPAGEHLWSARFGGDTGNRAQGHAVAIDADGGVVVTGGFTGTIDFGGGELAADWSQDAFVVKFDASGEHLWSKRFGGAGVGNDAEGRGVVVDDAGNVTLTGSFAGTTDFGGGEVTSTETDIFVAQFDASGAHRWSKNFGGSSYDDHGYSVAANSSGEVYLTGRFEGALDFGGGEMSHAGKLDIFLVKFGADGEFLWNHRFGGGHGEASRTSVLVDGSDTVWLAGAFRGDVDFGGELLEPAGWSDVFIARFDGAGDHLHSRLYGGVGRDYADGIAIGSGGEVGLAGRFMMDTDFGTGEITSAGSTDALVFSILP